MLATPLDRALHRLGEALRNEEARKALLSRLLLWTRRTLTALTILYFFAIFAAILLMSRVGENNMTLAFILYLPRQGFLLPLPFLFLITLPFHWRLALVQIPLAIIFIKFGMGWQLPPEAKTVLEAPESRPHETFTILTYNRGQHLNQSLQPFKNLTRPDLIALQDAPHRAARYANAPDYSDLPHTAAVGEFTVISRHPILSATLVEIEKRDGGIGLPASRFEIEFNDQKIAVYCVHAISPRDTLMYYRQGAFLLGVLGLPGTPWGEKRKINQQSWDHRIESVKNLLEIIDNEPLPNFLVGDFNAPAGGYIHRLLSQQLSDSHLAAGHGFGYTFPGRTRNPLSLGGPWMRIDYLFSSPHWKTLHSVTETVRTSQHRAVTAAFQLKQKPQT